MRMPSPCPFVSALNRPFMLFLALTLVLTTLLVARPLAGPSPIESGRTEILETYGQLPLSFEANQGQTDDRVKFLSRGSGYSLFLTTTEAVLALSKLAAPKTQDKTDLALITADAEESQAIEQAVLRMQLVGANSQPQMVGLEELPGKVNYFIGNDATKWRTNISTYAKIQYQGVYPGVDLVYYGNQHQLEYDFVVAPGADPYSIRLGFEGTDKLEVDALGDLILHIAGGQIRMHRPLIYQEVDGVRQEIFGGYMLKGERGVGFQVAAYDVSKPLIIDPVLVYSTFLGGSGNDRGFGIVVDAAGNAYVAGRTESTNFPTAGTPFQSANAGNGDGFVTKLNSSGSALLYSTYLGGSGNEAAGFRIAIDSSGNAHVTGDTTSTDFPTTPGAFQTTFAGGCCALDDAFVTKLNSTGSALVYSTYLGGSSDDAAIDIAVDSSGNAYVTGATRSSNFPTTSGAYQETFGGGGVDSFVTKLNSTGSALVYSTYLGRSSPESGGGIAVDSAGNAYATGITLSTNFPTTTGAFQTVHGGGLVDVYVTKLNASGSALVYSTFLGGSGEDHDSAGIAVDSAGNAYLTGYTFSTDFPTQNPLQASHGGGGSDARDAYVTKLNASGSALVYSTYLGGSSVDVGNGIAVDSTGNAYVTGSTASTNFPTTPGAFQTTSGGGADDAYVTKLNASGSALVYSTYLGGNGFDQANKIAVDSVGNAYVTGGTSSTNFPTTSGAFQTGFGGGTQDAFVAKIALTPQETTELIIDSLQDIVDSNPGTPLAGKIEDALAKTQSALAELAKTPPDNQAAVGNIEGAVGDLEAAVNDGLLDPAQGTQLMNQLAATARALAVDAINLAIAQGGDPQKINEAQQALDEGDVLRASGAFKDAVNKYKDALAKAESALP